MTVGASERGSERVSIEERDFRDRRQSCEVAATECGQQRSFKIGCCNFCKGLFLKAAWRCVDRNQKKLYDLQSKKNQSIHFMPSLIRKLFHKSEAPKDGLTQPQREAIVDLLNYCMYADNSVFLAEESQVYRDQFLASIKDRLGATAVKRRALDLCQELFLADGARSDEEDAVLQNLTELLE